MITQETAGRIWNCYREIAAGEKLLADMEETAARYVDDVRRETLPDAFGRQRQLELGIPSSGNGHRILNVAPDLAKSVIRAHIATMQAKLAEANEQARIELDSTVRPEQSV